MAVRSLLLTALVAGVMACSDAASDREGLHVVATTGVLSDVVADLVGEHGSVEALMGRGTDPHEFTPSAAQSALLRSAHLVVANGLGLEARLTDLLESAKDDGAVVIELAEGVNPLAFGDDSHAEAHEHEHGHGDLDPHFTLDPLRVADGIDLVAASLTELAPSVAWAERAQGVRADLEALDSEIREQLSSIPSERRKLVTSHDSLAYFADRYGFEVVGTVIPGGSTMAEASASDLADLAEALRREEITAIFAETTAPSSLAETVAAEVGEDVSVYTLYTDSLGAEGSEASTYAGMMRTNAATIATALGG